MSPKRVLSNLCNLSKEELITLITENCPSILTSCEVSDSLLDTNDGVSAKKEKLDAPRAFDSSSYGSRMVALKVAYFGLKYQGFASQIGLLALFNSNSINNNIKKNRTVLENNTIANTVEDHIFRALIRTRLILDPQECNYSRCGRTDSGVSATGQVIALRLRTSNKKKSESNDSSAIDYCNVLNKQLPEDIRILDWAFVSDNFSARFSCSSRLYHYYFSSKHYDNSTRKVHNLDVEKMRSAAKELVGVHDFRNFCKRDPSKPNQSFTREIIECYIEEIPASGSFFRFVCKGSSFLYHQIRCIMSILFMIGSGSESVDLVTAMLTRIIPSSSGPAGPLIHYEIASEVPLTLHECRYDKPIMPIIEWNKNLCQNSSLLSAHIHRLWEAKQCESFIYQGLLDSFHSDTFVSGCEGSLLKKLLHNSK